MKNYDTYDSDLAYIPASIRQEMPTNDGGKKIYKERKILLDISTL
jgi:hypothetical protein